MTVSVQTPYTAATANGVTTVFPYSFQILDAADLNVTLDGVIQTTGFTVSGVGDDLGGNVTFSVAPANTVAVLLARNPVLDRDTDYAQFGKIPSAILNADFDRIWLTLQKFANDFRRALKLPVDTATDQLIDSTAGERANALVTFDPNGNLAITPITSIAVNVSSGSFTVDTFDGNGATVNFTLSRAPGVINNTTVFVGGSYLRKDQYSISGTTLTFDVAPASGTSNIEVCQSVALEAGSPADGTVTLASLANGVLAASAAGLAKMGDGFLAASTAGRLKMADKFVTLAKMADMATGKLLGNVSGVTGAPAEIDVAQTFPQIHPITATVSSNALTLRLNPTRIDFRSATLTDGTVSTRHVGAAISLVISSGSTLGTVNAVAARIAILAIDNAGTVELAAVNLAGGTNLDEVTLISTTAEGGAGAADSALTIYSATARTNVPFRVVGFIDITEATAGTWATAPTRIQGIGGQARTVLGASYLSADQTITSAGSLTLAHSLGAAPKLVMAWLKCGTGEAGYTAGDIVLAPATNADSGGDSKGVSVTADTTNLNIRFGSSAAVFNLLNKTTGTGANITNANWTIHFRAFS